MKPNPSKSQVPKKPSADLPEPPVQIDPDDALIQEPTNNVFGNQDTENEFDDESETANVSE